MNVFSYVHFFLFFATKKERNKPKKEKLAVAWTGAIFDGFQVLSFNNSSSDSDSFGHYPLRGWYVIIYSFLFLRSGHMKIRAFKETSKIVRFYSLKLTVWTILLTLKTSVKSWVWASYCKTFTIVVKAERQRLFLYALTFLKQNYYILYSNNIYYV